MDREIHKVDNGHSISLIQDLDEFRKLKDTWNNLAENCRSYNPWLSWDWFNLCLKYFLNNNKVFALVLYKADRIVAIAPFLLRKEKYKGIFWTNKIELMGSSYSPIGDILFGDLDEDAKKLILSNIIYYFSYVFRNWNIIELDKIIGKDSVPELFGDVIVNSGLKYRTYSCFNNWYSDGIDYGFGRFFGNLPKNLHRNVKRYEKKLNGIGKLQFEMRTNNEDIDHYLDLYDEVRAKSWKAVERDRAFHREFLKYAAKKGWIRLSILYVNALPVAAAKYLVWNNTAFGMDSIYDESYAKFSPGAVLTSKIFEYVIDIDGVSEIDLGRGDEPYKMEWVANKREIKGITIFNQTLKGQFLAFLMTKVLPVIERNKNILAAKNRIVGHLRKYRQR